MNFQIEDFFPYYVLNNKDDIVYPSKENIVTNMYSNIVMKEEFSELKLKEIEGVKKNEFLNHQKFISRIINQYTPYDRLLLYHGLGTGKTCLMSAIAEYNKEINEDNKDVLILVKNQVLKDNVIDEIACVCKADKYEINKIDKKTGQLISIRKQRSSVLRKIKKTYTVMTFRKLVNSIQELSNETINKMYGERIIIIDEAHNIRDIDDEKDQVDEDEVNTSYERRDVKKEKEDIDLYTEIHRFLHITKGIKVLLLTATPMRDKPSEICYLLNLLLPMNKQLQVRDFDNVYFKDNKLINDNILKNEYMYGMVSYLRSMQGGEGTPKVIYKGDLTDKLKYMKVVELDMMKEQQKGYTIAYKMFTEDKKSKLWIDARQASSFVFPDQTFGISSEGKYIDIEMEKEDNKIKNYNVNKLFEKYLKKNGNDVESMLNQLKKLSIKFWYSIKLILDNPKQKFFIYTKFVKGGGAILLGALLKLFGLNQAPLLSTEESISLCRNEEENNKEEKVLGNNIAEDRFMILTSNTMSSSQISYMVNKVFNHPNNSRGEYIRVVIGSHVIAEGVSFKCIRHMIVLTPYWNNATIDQAIGRAVRSFSHKDLPINERDVTIHKLCAMPKYIMGEEELESIDEYMYNVSEIKDIKIKQIERAIKESAIDCINNRKRNILKEDKPYTKECDYMETCSYKCMQGDIDERINDTYNLYYASREINVIIKKLNELFGISSGYSFDEILQYLQKSPDINIKIFPVILARALNKIITENMIIVNCLGFNNYLREKDNYYFLTDDPLSAKDSTSMWYASNPIPEKSYKSFDEAYESFENEQLSEILELIKKNPSKVLSIIENVGNNIANIIIETIFTYHIIGIENQVITLVLKKYRNIFNKIQVGDTEYWINNFNEKKPRFAPIDIKDPSEWTDNISEEAIQQAKQIKETKINQLRNNPYGYYAIVNPQEKDIKKQFKIKNTHEIRKTQTGKEDKRKLRLDDGTVCGTGIFQPAGLINLIIDLILIAIQYGNNGPLQNINKPIPKDISFHQFIKELRADKQRINITNKLNKIWYMNQVKNVLQNYSFNILKDIIIKVINTTKISSDKKTLKEYITDTNNIVINDVLEILNKLGAEYITIIEAILNDKYIDNIDINDIPNIKDIKDEKSKIYIQRIEQIYNSFGEHRIALYRLIKMTGSEMCSHVKNWFESNNLVLVVSNK